MYKMAAMTSSNSNFQKLRNTTLKNIPESILVNFNLIGPAVWALDRTQTHTHKHTDRGIDTFGSILIFSVRMTKFKNGAKRGSNP